MPESKSFTSEDMPCRGTVSGKKEVDIQSSHDGSPDLNVIDHLWSHLERSVQKHQITSKEQLKTVLQEEWLNIVPETTRHLVESMPRRLEAVISAKGYATKY
ncbi:hypothetical protein TNCV_4786071 [Trichonephila clavipes]|nr:hypothetical protein TNCV_4786071 [Trichonephila clavipes]